jgi:hypothetical protein
MKNSKIILTIPTPAKNRLIKHPNKEEITAKVSRYLTRLLMNKELTTDLPELYAIFCSRFKYPETKFKTEVLDETKERIRVERIRGRVGKWIKIDTSNFPNLQIRYIQLNAVGQFKVANKVTIREAKRLATETETIHYTKLDDFLQILIDAHGYVVGEKESFKGFSAAIADLSGENERNIQRGIERKLKLV